MKATSKTTEQLTVTVISVLLLGIWSYSGLEKLINWDGSLAAFHNQPFPDGLAERLAYAVPVIELVLAVLLLTSTLRWWGLLGSVMVLSVFTTYIGLVWWNVFERVPCNCAGFLESMGWTGHLYFNGLMLLLGTIALKLASHISPT
ncbi:hypothetical protein DN752_04320 [Echinicola strongylocentroti]|uniref:Methylamine utilisation protein MauE domain-containing protein n=1 Tax=Echinicola strongylocentroti TaxID=1795355 RepID=A0A2Z4IRW6_9BACT|nr:hypothetical protein DN752_04320 [Echinicola strongylocentroti]